MILQHKAASHHLPVFSDIADAARLLYPLMPMSPMFKASAALTRQLGVELFIKAECCTEGGSFKLHGALTYALRLDEATRQKGLVAYSSGNHAIGVAVAACKLGCPATVFVPDDMPGIKRHKLELYGANILTYNRQDDDRAALATAYADKYALSLIPPFNHPWTISGQGVVGLEIMCQAAKHDFTPEVIFTPCGGGGLSSGIALAMLGTATPGELVICEPSTHNDAQKLLMQGVRVCNKPSSVTICDALQAPVMGSIPQDIMHRYQKSGRPLRALSVHDKFVKCAIALAWREFGLMLEPSGAVALATALKFRKRFEGKRLVVVASGGNVDPEKFQSYRAWGDRHMSRILHLG